MIDRETLAQRVEPVNPTMAQIIRKPDAQIEQVPTPFFARGVIYRVAWYGPRRPVGFTVGLADSLTVPLPSNPDGFVELAGRAGLSLGSSETRLNYVLTLLKTTRDFQRRFQILDAFSDIELINKPTPEEQQRYKELQAKYGNVIRRPAITDAPPWTATLYALVGQDLARLDIKLSPDGKVERADTVLEKDIPIAYMK